MEWFMTHIPDITQKTTRASTNQNQSATKYTEVSDFFEGKKRKEISTYGVLTNKISSKHIFY